ncbi:MAG: hypothetical protein PHT48_02680 [Dechloromonas sp.]|nr:hypothetical protein [Dechloromonas sp.]
MSLIHDVDVLLLLATAMAAKRRPAEALDIVAAIDLLQNNVPVADKLVDAFPRLTAAGLLTASGEGVQLTAAAEALIETLPRKVETPERLFALRQQLADWAAPAEAALAVVPAITVDALRAAILAHRAAAASSAKNLLVAKPKPAETTKRPGQRQRKPMPARRRKD